MLPQYRTHTLGPHRPPSLTAPTAGWGSERARALATWAVRGEVPSYPDPGDECSVCYETFSDTTSRPPDGKRPVRIGAHVRMPSHLPRPRGVPGLRDPGLRTPRCRSQMPSLPRQPHPAAAGIKPPVPHGDPPIYRAVAHIGGVFPLAFSSRSVPDSAAAERAMTHDDALSSRG